MRLHLRLALGGLLLLFSMPGFCFAQQAASSEAQQSPPAKFIQNLGNRAITVIANKSLTPEQREEQYRQILRDSFDLQTIGRFALGNNWNMATPQQQQEYMKLFEELVVRTYSDRLGLYKGESFQVKAVRQESSNDFLVHSEIQHPGGEPPTIIDWRVRKEGDNKFAVLDVVVDGVSQSVTQRQEYASIIQNAGGNIDALLTRMRERLQQTRPTQAQSQPFQTQP
jgi:phospholipid transport system substrate-binding protein